MSIARRLMLCVLLALAFMAPALLSGSPAWSASLEDQQKPVSRKLNVPFSHGHYCGVGNSQTKQPPIDALDRACMDHDACAGSAAVPACSCHQKLVEDARLISTDPDQSGTMRALARNIAGAISRVPCSGEPVHLEPVAPEQDLRQIPKLD